EIKAICDVLFDARVQMLVGLRRTPVAKEDEEATDYLFGRKPATNAVTGAVAVPYEISFQGFSGELAAVLEGFYRSSNCFVVKNNYEKVILSVVLLGLAVAAVLLLTWVGNEKRALEEIEQGIIQVPPKPLKPADLSTNEMVLQRLVKASNLHLSGDHNLFNPV